jgi:hypothetical protein
LFAAVTEVLASKADNNIAIAIRAAEFWFIIVPFPWCSLDYPPRFQGHIDLDAKPATTVEKHLDRLQVKNAAAPICRVRAHLNFPAKFYTVTSK